MSDLISRSDAINAVHKYFVDKINNEPHEIDEDGDDVFTDMKSVNALFHHNKMVSKAIKALPSAEAVQGEWVEKGGELVCSVCGNSVSFSRTPKGWVLGRFCQTCGARMYKGGEE